MSCALARCGPTAVFGLHPESDPPSQPPGVEVWRSSWVHGLTSASGVNRASLDWLRHPGAHPSDAWFAPDAADELTELIQRFRPDVVIVDHLWLQRYIDTVRGLGIPVVLNAHNIEGELQSAIARTHGGGALPRLVGERTRTIEASAVRAVDQVWVCSDFDAATLARSYPDAAPSAVVPNAVDVDSYPAPATQDARTVIFPGVFAYPPNAAAAEFLVERVLPLLAEDVTLLLVGREPPAHLQSERVVVTGAVEDVRPYLARASALAAPLFDGGGTRFKLLEAFAARIPSVTTRKGAEGIDVEDGRHLLLAETPEEFAVQLAALYGDSALREALTENAYALVRSRYSYEAAARAVGSALSSLV